MRQPESRHVPLRAMTRMAILIGLSAAGACVKIPALTGTPALDSAPGYFAALALGAGQGAVVAALGHLLTALTAGFPLGLALHVLIAAGMAGCAAVVAVAGKRYLWAGFAVGVLGNGLVFPALFILLPGFGPAFFTAMVVPLLVASALNLGLACLSYELVARAQAWIRVSARPSPGSQGRP